MNQAFEITVAYILTDYPARTFVVTANDIISAQVRVWRKVNKWYHVIAAARRAGGHAVRIAAAPKRPRIHER